MSAILNQTMPALVIMVSMVNPAITEQGELMAMMTITVQSMVDQGLIMVELEEGADPADPMLPMVNMVRGNQREVQVVMLEIHLVTAEMTI